MASPDEARPLPMSFSFAGNHEVTRRIEAFADYVAAKKGSEVSDVYALIIKDQNLSLTTVGEGKQVTLGQFEILANAFGKMDAATRDFFDLRFGNDSKQSFDLALEKKDWAAVHRVFMEYPTTDVAANAFSAFAIHYLDLGQCHHAFPAIERALKVKGVSDSGKHRLLAAAAMAANCVGKTASAEVYLKEFLEWGKKGSVKDEPYAQINEEKIRVSLRKWNRTTTNRSQSLYPFSVVAFSAKFPIPAEEAKLTRTSIPTPHEVPTRFTHTNTFLHPVVVDGVLYYRTLNRAVAYDLKAKKIKWSRPRTEAFPDIALNANFNPEDLAALGTIAVDGKHVFAVERPRASGVGRIETRLAAYHAGSGVSAWSLDGFTPPDPKDPKREIAEGPALFASAPIIVDNYVYILVSTRATELYLLRLNGDTGEVLNHLHLGFEAQVNQKFGTAPCYHHHLAWHNGDVVAHLSDGTLLTVDAAKFALRWARSEKQWEQPIEKAQLRLTASWNSPPLFMGGKIVMMARSTRRLICLDAQTGKTVWQMPTNELSYLMAGSADTVYAVEPGSVVARRLSDGKVIWKNPLVAIAGHGLLTGDRLTFPITSGHLVVINAKSGITEDKLSLETKNPTENYGHLVQWENGFFVQTPDEISRYEFESR